ncbi:DNA-binding protein [Candidatus Parcubacteria bacterium]|nr:MAG: DNA-binding protein [Candidatus Parcubacteria bacterium]
MKKRFISSMELAKLIGISHVAAYKKILRGEIKAEKVGRNFIIPVRELPFKVSVRRNNKIQWRILQHPQ